MLERREKPTPDMFGELLQNASTMGDLRNCPVSILSFPWHGAGGWGEKGTERTEEVQCITLVCTFNVSIFKVQLIMIKRVFLVFEFSISHLNY